MGLLFREITATFAAEDWAGLRQSHFRVISSVPAERHQRHRAGGAARDDQAGLRPVRHPARGDRSPAHRGGPCATGGYAGCTAPPLGHRDHRRRHGAHARGSRTTGPASWGSGATAPSARCSRSSPCADPPELLAGHFQRYSTSGRPLRPYLGLPLDRPGVGEVLEVAADGDPGGADRLGHLARRQSRRPPRARRPSPRGGSPGSSPSAARAARAAQRAEQPVDLVLDELGRCLVELGAVGGVLLELGAERRRT